MRITRLFCVLSVLMGFARVSCARMPEAPPPHGAILVRIGLAVNAPNAAFRCSRRWTIQGLSAKRGATVGQRREVVFRVASKQIRAYQGDQVVAVGRYLRLTAGHREARFAFEGSHYRGDMVIFPSGEGGLTVVNVLSLEDYLLGVVPAEMGPQPENRLEALKAQAIAARSYTLAHMGRRSLSGFDFLGDVRDQVYWGASGESSLTSKAVLETAGQVATYEGRPILAFYCANCGGHTADVREVWGGPTEPYLEGVRDASPREDFGGGSQDHRWSETWSAQELTDILRESLPGRVTGLGPLDLGQVRDIVTVGRSPSGRVQTLEIRTSQGTHRVQGDAIRWALRRPMPGRPVLRSTYFALRSQRGPDGALVRLEAFGGGNGHGVGLCQTGAMGMADRGYTAQEILQHYYPGVQIVEWPGRIPVCSRPGRGCSEDPQAPCSSGPYSVEALASDDQATAQAAAAEARLLTDTPVEVVQLDGLWKVWVGNATSPELLEREARLLGEWGLTGCWVTRR